MKNRIDTATSEIDVYLQDFEQNLEETAKQIAENITNQCESGNFVFFLNTEYTGKCKF